MNIQSAYKYLKLYYNWRKKKDHSEPSKLIVILVLLQSKFNFGFDIKYNALSIEDAISKVYQNIPDNVFKNDVYRQYYLYAAYQKQISIENICMKIDSIGISKENGHEIIELVLALMYLTKKNMKYIKDVENILITLVYLLEFSDLKTEAVYILFLVNPYAVKRKWIDEIVKNQQNDGSLVCNGFGKYKDAQAHHTALGLILYISYSKFKKLQKIIKYVGVIFVIFIYVYVYFSLKQYKANDY